MSSESNAQNPMPSASPRRRLKVLISAYACEPGKGSEAGLGWSMALQMAKLHDVYVLTRANNESVITPALPDSDAPKFIYYDLPRWARWWKRGSRGAQVYYYIWQVCAGRMLRRLTSEMNFDVCHHVTFIRYWMPHAISWARCPSLVGPVGGGEIGPVCFDRHFSIRGWVLEKIRRLRLLTARYDPCLRKSISSTTAFVVPTLESELQLKRFNTRLIFRGLDPGLLREEFESLASLKKTRAATDKFIFVSSGRLIHWKGFELGIRAFARANIINAEYWILGDGPELRRLKKISKRCGVDDRVFFLGRLPRADALQKIQKANVLVHPSFHDTGGWVCMEAKALGKAVICLDLGGPAEQVENNHTGYKIQVTSWGQTILRMSEVMEKLYGDPMLLERIGHNAQSDVEHNYLWETKCSRYSEIYFSIINSEISGAEND